MGEEGAARRSECAGTQQGNECSSGVKIVILQYSPSEFN